VEVNIIFIRNQADLARQNAICHAILVSPLLLTTAKWVSFSHNRCETEARIIIMQTPKRAPARPPFQSKSVMNKDFLDIGENR
jgi:V8-like Glu-specific endopeptidase